MPEIGYDSRREDKNPYSIHSYCSLSFMVKPQKPTTEFSTRIFKIHPANHYEVVKFFHKVISWFYDTKMNDIFLITENGKKIFNSDYRDLILAIPDHWNKMHVMKAWPSIVRYYDEESEGIGITVGNSENLVFIPLRYIEELFFFLKGFRFSEEMILLTQSFYFAAKANRIKDINMPRK